MTIFSSIMGLKSSEKLKKNSKLAFQVGEENNQWEEIQLSISLYLKEYVAIAFAKFLNLLKEHFAFWT